MKRIIIVHRWARIRRQFAGANFRDFEYLKFRLKMDDKKINETDSYRIRPTFSTIIITSRLLKSNGYPQLFKR